jgi:hypothetical protein
MHSPRLIYKHCFVGRAWKNAGPLYFSKKIAARILD